MSSPPSKVLAGRLRAAREEAELSQRELAERLGVSQGAISLWEAGSRQPGVDDLYAIADALNVDLYDLLPRRAGPPLRAVLRAVAAELEQTSLADAMVEFVDAAEALPRPERRVWSRGDSPEAAAGDLLEQLGITDPPVDVAAVARMSGIPVLFWTFEQALSGLVVDTLHGPVIGVNNEHAPNRQRFTIAHELGHVMLRHLDSFHVDLGSTSEDGNPPGYNWRHERAANDFAAALLMSASLITRAHKDVPAVSGLAATFGVSELAMGFRLRSLGLT